MSNENYPNYSSPMSSRGGDAFAAFAIGMVAGAVVSLLLAPATGSDTRRKVGDFARKFGEKAREGAEQAKGYVNQARGRVESAVNEGREAYDRSQV
jgi:gas vesicle protein